MEVPDEVEILLKDLDEKDITSILKKWTEVTNIRKKLDELEEMLKTKIKVHLRERNWDRYLDKETKISVTITNQKRETLDKDLIRNILSEEQFAQVLRISSFEKMSIITPEMRTRLRKYVKKRKKL